jgi:hypothetical protein
MEAVGVGCGWDQSRRTSKQLQCVQGGRSVTNATKDTTPNMEMTHAEQAPTWRVEDGDDADGERGEDYVTGRADPGGDRVGHEDGGAQLALLGGLPGGWGVGWGGWSVSWMSLVFRGFGNTIPCTPKIAHAQNAPNGPQTAPSSLELQQPLGGLLRMVELVLVHHDMQRRVLM